MSNDDTDHVGPIVFSNETARRQLEEDGEVITFRKNQRTTGETWWREERTGPKRGDVIVEREKPVCPHGTGMALESHVELSGFNSVHEWQQAIRRLNGGNMPREGWLYRAA